MAQRPKKPEAKPSAELLGAGSKGRMLYASLARCEAAKASIEAERARANEQVWTIYSEIHCVPIDD